MDHFNDMDRGNLFKINIFFYQFYLTTSLILINILAQMPVTNQISQVAFIDPIVFGHMNLVMVIGEIKLGFSLR
jgi:hypothetical protein